MPWVRQCLKKSKPDKFCPSGANLVMFPCCWGVSAFTELGEWCSTSPFVPVAALTETAHLQGPQDLLGRMQVCGRTEHQAMHCSLVTSWLRWEQVTEGTQWMDRVRRSLFSPSLFIFFLFSNRWGPCNQGNQGEWKLYPSRFCFENLISWVYRITSEFFACHLLEVWRFLGSDTSREGTSELRGHLNEQVPKNGQIHEQQQGTNWHLQHRSTQMYVKAMALLFEIKLTEIAGEFVYFNSSWNETSGFWSIIVELFYITVIFYEKTTDYYTCI